MKIFQSNIKIGIIVLGVSILIGVLLSLIVGWTAERFFQIAVEIVISNSILLGFAVLISMHFTRYFVGKINNNILILLLSFGLILGAGILSFLVFFISDPTTFIYSSNRTIPFLLINQLFFISFNIISSGFVIFQYTVLKKEKVLAEEIVMKTKMEAELLANRRIIDSIQYAKRIQSSLLPNSTEIKKHLPDSFFIWLPREMVGGDVYFTSFFESGYILAVIDCTGHGVPGAFMTMLASSGLNRIVNREKVRDPAEILKRLNFFVKMSLHQDTEDALSDDGMDIAICHVNSLEQTLTFSGSRLSITYLHNDKIHSIKGNRQSIGYKKSDLNFEFTNHQIDIQKSMMFYLHTDGIVDQLGGDRRMPFGKRRFYNLLLEGGSQPFAEQQKMIAEAFEEYKGKNDTQDDITVIGFSS